MNSPVKTAPRLGQLPHILCGGIALIAGAWAQIAVAQSFAAPNPLDLDGSGKIVLGYFAFATDIEDRIFAADKSAANRLSRVSNSDELEVFVIVVDDWTQAGLANAGLIGSVALRDRLDALVGRDEMLALHKGQSDGAAYDSYERVLFAVTQHGGRPIGEDCLTQAILSSLYQGSAARSEEVLACVEASQ